MRATRTAVVATLFAIVATLATAGIAAGQAPATQRPTVRLDVTRGFEGRARAYSSNPISVLIESDKLFSGWIEVQVPTNGFNPTVYRRQIEVPAGSRKVVYLVLPRASVQEVRAVDRKGRVLATIASPAGTTLERGEALIGVLAGERFTDQPVSIPGVVTAGEALPLSLEIVDLGAPALEPLSHLIVDAGMVPRLSDRQRDALLVYAASGGELIVAAATEEDVAFVPEPLRGTAGTPVRRTAAGHGAVTVALEPFAAGAWSPNGKMWRDTVRPTNVARWADDSSQSWPQALAQSRRFRSAAIAWLLVFLIAYVILVGPLGFIVLSRKRKRELAWIAIPMVAVVFAGGAFAAGRGVRSGAIKQAVAIAVLDRHSQTVAAGVGLRSRDGGVERSTFSEDWIIDALANAGGTSVVELSGGRATSELDLVIGAIGTNAIRRTTLGANEPAGTLSQSSGQEFSGLVRNTSGFDLQEASVHFGGAAVQLGSLSAGQEMNATLEPGVVDLRFDGMMQKFGGDFEGFVEVSHGGQFNRPTMLLQAARYMVGFGEQGRAFLAGWADLKQAGKRLGLGSVEGTALVLLPLETRADRDMNLPIGAVRRDIIDTDGQIQNFGGGPQADLGNAKRTTVRFTLPAGSRPHELFLTNGFPGAMEEGVVMRGRRAGVRPQQVEKFEVTEEGVVVGSQVQVAPVAPPEEPPVPGPPDLPQIFPPEGALASKMSYFDSRSGTWKTLKPAVGAEIPLPIAALSERGEVFVRITTDFRMGVQLGALIALGGRAR